jgi:putative ABC transport system permease protein
MTPLSLRFALRELRGGVRGFRIFLACLALGVAAIAAAGSTAEAFRHGIAAQSREILGGDLSVTIDQRHFDAREMAAMNAAGRVALATATRAMAQGPSGERRLVEIRGVSQDYPLAGKVELKGAASLAQAFQARDGVPGAAVEQSLIDRLHLHLGEVFQVGETKLAVGAVLESEPDRLSRGFALGPRVLTSLQTMQHGGFLIPGLPFVETARIATFRQDRKPADQAAALKAALGGGDFRLRHRDEATPGLDWIIDQLEYFLGFIGLASLIAGGLGVFGAVSAYLQGRRPSIATLKALGGSGVLIRNLYLIQIAILAAAGIAIGVLVGAAAPLALGAWLKDRLPVPALFSIYPAPLFRAAGFGLLSAAAFSLAPLARARTTPPASLFRHDLPGRLGLSVETVGAGLAAAGLAALAVVTAPTRLAAALMIGGVAAAFGLLWLMGAGAARLAGRLRTAARGPARLGLANLAGPGSAARTAAPAIGLGVALLAAVVLIQSSLLREVQDVAPKSAPALVFTEIPGARTAEFDALVAKAFDRNLTPDTYYRTPVTSGRIIRLKGRAVDRNRIRRGERWAFDNDLQIAVIDQAPPNAGVVAGRWWPAGYRGQPQIALDADAAEAGGLAVGDQVTLQILGREIDARLAATRKVEPGSFGPAFSLVIDPAALEGAVLPNIAIAKATRAQEERVTRALGQAFPQVDVISVREQLEAATDIFERVSLAIRSAAAVAALAGVLVLAGAIAARARQRVREAAILKVLGASRAQILAAYVLEYGAVGLIAGAIGVALGYAAAWPVVVRVFHAHWSVDWAGVFALVGAAVALAAIGGLLAAAQALSQRPSGALRAE